LNRVVGPYSASQTNALRVELAPHQRAFGSGETNDLCRHIDGISDVFHPADVDQAVGRACNRLRDKSKASKLIWRDNERAAPIFEMCNQAGWQPIDDCLKISIPAASGLPGCRLQDRQHHQECSATEPNAARSQHRSLPLRFLRSIL